MTEEQMIATVGNTAEKKILKAYFEYKAAKYKYESMLDAYEKGEEVCTPFITFTFPDNKGAQQ